MEWLIWLGTAVSLVGLGGLVWCIVTVTRAKRRKLPDAEMRAEVQRVVPVNMGALLLSALGLMMVVVGILFA